MKSILRLCLILFAFNAHSASPTPEVCQFILDAPRGHYGDGIRDYTQRQGWVDANNDGKEEYTELAAYGTAHFTQMEIYGDASKAGKGILTLRETKEQQTFDRLGFGLSDAQWLTYKGETYFLRFFGNSHTLVSSVWHFGADDKGDKICGFDVEHDLTIYPTPAASTYFSTFESLDVDTLQRFCRNINEISGKNLVPYAEASHTSLGSAAPGGTADIKAKLEADVFNRGQPETLYLTEIAASGGAGCTAHYLTRGKDLEQLKGLETIRQRNIAMREYTANDARQAIEDKKSILQTFDANTRRLNTALEVDYLGAHRAPCNKNTYPQFFTYAGQTFLLRGKLDAKGYAVPEDYQPELWYFPKEEPAFEVCTISVSPQMRLIYP